MTDYIKHLLQILSVMSPGIWRYSSLLQCCKSLNSRSIFTFQEADLHHQHNPSSWSYRSWLYVCHLWSLVSDSRSSLPNQACFILGDHYLLSILSCDAVHYLQLIQNLSLPALEQTLVLGFLTNHLEWALFSRCQLLLPFKFLDEPNFFSLPVSRISMALYSQSRPSVCYIVQILLEHWLGFQLKVTRSGAVCTDQLTCFHSSSPFDICLSRSSFP